MLLIKPDSFLSDVRITPRTLMFFCLWITSIVSGKTIFSTNFEDSDVSEFSSYSDSGWLKVNVFEENNNHFLRLKSGTPKKHLDLRLVRFLPIPQPETKSVNVKYRIRKQNIDSPWWMFWRRDPDVRIAFYWMNEQQESVHLETPDQVIKTIKNEWTQVDMDFKMKPDIAFVRIYLSIKNYHSGTLDLDDLVVSWE